MVVRLYLLLVVGTLMAWVQGYFVVSLVQYAVATLLLVYMLVSEPDWNSDVN